MPSSSILNDTIEYMRTYVRIQKMRTGEVCLLLRFMQIPRGVVKDIHVCFGFKAVDYVMIARAQGCKIQIEHKHLVTIAQRGHVPLLQWIRTRTRTIIHLKSLCVVAARTGNIKLLQWLRARDGPHVAPNWFITFGMHLRTIKWLYVLGRLSSQWVEFASSNGACAWYHKVTGQLPYEVYVRPMWKHAVFASTIQWLHIYCRCDDPYSLCRRDLFDVLYKLGYVPTRADVEYAIKCKSVSKLKWFLSKISFEFNPNWSIYPEVIRRFLDDMHA